MNINQHAEMLMQLFPGQQIYVQTQKLKHLNNMRNIGQNEQKWHISQEVTG